MQARNCWHAPATWINEKLQILYIWDPPQASWMSAQHGRSLSTDWEIQQRGGKITTGSQCTAILQPHYVEVQHLCAKHNWAYNDTGTMCDGVYEGMNISREYSMMSHSRTWTQWYSTKQYCQIEEQVSEWKIYTVCRTKIPCWFSIILVGIIFWSVLLWRQGTEFIVREINTIKLMCSSECLSIDSEQIKILFSHNHQKSKLSLKPFIFLTVRIHAFWNNFLKNFEKG